MVEQVKESERKREKGKDCVWGVGSGYGGCNQLSWDGFTYSYLIILSVSKTKFSY